MLDTPVYVNVLLFVLGLYIIIKGSDLFLDNAVWIAKASGISQLIIGATVVSICTTLPEVVSSVTAALKGTGDMALGNAVGSIICNSGVILGSMLLLITAKIRRKHFMLRGAFLLALLLLALVFALPPPLSEAFANLRSDEAVFHISRLEGLALLVVVVIYLALNYWECKRESVSELGMAAAEARSEAPLPTSSGEWVRRLAWFALGGVLVAFGAYLLIEFGQRLARDMGVSEAVISLIFVAFGTSLPELFTAISAVRKNVHDISVGNVVGANVLNIALVTGGASVVSPLTINDRLLIRFDLPFAFIICVVVFLEGAIAGKLGRKTGVLLLLVYAFYLASMLFMGRIG